MVGRERAVVRYEGKKDVGERGEERGKKRIDMIERWLALVGNSAIIVCVVSEGKKVSKR